MLRGSVEGPRPGGKRRRVTWDATITSRVEFHGMKAARHRRPQPPGTSRRSLLTKGAALVAGAVGASVVATSAALGAAPATDGGSTLSLYVRDVRFRSSLAAPRNGRRTAASSTPAASPSELLRRRARWFGRRYRCPAVQPRRRDHHRDGLGRSRGRLRGRRRDGRYAGATRTYSTELSAGTRGRDAAFRISRMGTKG